MRIYSLILSFTLSLFISSCAPQPTLTAELVPRSLRAVNLEETISRRDELMMAYSLTSYDAKNKPVAVVNGGWGVETVKKDEQLDLQTGRTIAGGPAEHSPAKPISLQLPRNGRIVASVVLIEVDDYIQARQTISKIQKIHNIVALPIGLLLTATEVLTPLKYVSAGLVASGIGLQLVDKLDDDDLLGQSSVDLREADLRQKKQQLVHVPAVFTGQNMKDAFDYRLEYDILLKTVKIQPVRQ
jgi:hypothetical protein